MRKYLVNYNTKYNANAYPSFLQCLSCGNYGGKRWAMRLKEDSTYSSVAYHPKCVWQYESCPKEAHNLVLHH